MSDLDQALRHKYRLDGQELVNVTSISGLLDDGKSSAFAGAAVKLTREGKNYRDEWKASGERGTRVHGYCEAFLSGQAIDMVVSDEGFVNALELFIHEADPQPIEMEQIVLSHEGYGGRFDLIATLSDEIWLIDVKTGKPYPIEHALQLAAYRYADGIAQYDADGELTSLRPIPPVTRTACLYVHEDGTYKLMEYDANAEAWNVFLGLLDAYQWTRTDAMRLALKESRA